MTKTPVAGEVTPAGLQNTRLLHRRRALVLSLNILTYAAFLAVLARVLGAGGWSWPDVTLFVAAAIGAPWTVLGFWNAILGLWLLHGVRDGLGRVAPFAAAGAAGTPIALRTAVLMTLRNEDPGRALARLMAVKASLDRTGAGDRFAYFLLSDTSDLEIAARENAAVQEWQDAEIDATIVYRRRTENTGYKAGNLRDFCERWGDEFDLMLPLDADSIMAGETVIAMVRIMECYPRLGLLQSLVVGMPSDSAFARVFQFGMRHGMRSYTMGSAWWGGDCGPFWGHNALVRIAPFVAHCDLPVLPGQPPLGGHILSHDQVEAVLMRRAGYEVRVLPVETGSWEENPPNVLEFSRRDLRWCQGNMQYWRLLAMPGLPFMSRFQLVWAILMFVSVPAWTATIALLPFKLIDGEDAATFPAELAIGLFIVFQAMSLMPKIAGLLDIAFSGATERYGGPARFIAGAVIEIAFCYVLGAIVTLRTSIFMVGLAFGRSITWGGQARDTGHVSWMDALRELWPQTLFGVAVTGALAALSPTVLAWSTPLIAGYVLAVPFAVFSAHPAVGAAFVRRGLNGVPEDFGLPAELRRLRTAPTFTARPVPVAPLTATADVAVDD
ncbi:MAG TPA: glucans biosynthesis glucosyltransferase MdoH [Alphaproteobacteria bacterium]|nr:glucans biosynthesis glucosyltransferase MdoH [Alphaproteobacteria bacterium]